MNRKKVWLPIVVVMVASLVGFVVMATAPEIETTPLKARLPALRVVEPVLQDVRLQVHSQGTVVPRTESELVPEVSGPVLWVSPSLASGGFFSRDEPLLRIDPRDSQTMVARARADVARAEGEAEHASSELRRQQGLARENATSSSHLSAAKRAERVASANLEAAWASLYQAQRDLERCEMRAPFDGRTREEHVDIGQFVSRGVPIATLYATDFAEIRLPVADHQLAFLEMGSLAPNAMADEGPEVVLRARFAGRDLEWRGRVVRIEGEIDPRSRMLHMVARVEDPYGTRSTPGADPMPGTWPLAVGLFVQAKIAGRVAEDVIVVPRTAIRDGGKIAVVDAQDLLHLRDAEVIRIEEQDVLIRADLEPGDRIGTSQLQWMVDGMPVQPVSEQLGARS